MYRRVDQLLLRLDLVQMEQILLSGIQFLHLPHAKLLLFVMKVIIESE